jgi:hypothetical protein
MREGQEAAAAAAVTCKRGASVVQIETLLPWVVHLLAARHRRLLLLLLHHVFDAIGGGGLDCPGGWWLSSRAPGGRVTDGTMLRQAGG